MTSAEDRHERQNRLFLRALDIRSRDGERLRHLASVAASTKLSEHLAALDTTDVRSEPAIYPVRTRFGRTVFTARRAWPMGANTALLDTGDLITYGAHGNGRALRLEVTSVNAYNNESARLTKLLLKAGYPTGTNVLVIEGNPTISLDPNDVVLVLDDQFERVGGQWQNRAGRTGFPTSGAIGVFENGTPALVHYRTGDRDNPGTWTAVDLALELTLLPRS